MQKIFLIIGLSVIIFSSSCKGIKSKLVHAKDYVIVAEHSPHLNTNNRTVKDFWITSDANTYDEFAQTSMLAAYELSKKHKNDLTTIFLTPAKELVRTNYYYALVNYASDNKGATGLSGLDEKLFTKGKWFVRSSQDTLSEEELIMVSLWFKYQKDFPSRNPLSSLSFDEESLRKHIAKELNIKVEDVKLPDVIRNKYIIKEIKHWMYPEPD
jgi:hypothetical protein